MIGQVTGWMEQQFPGDRKISKDEVVQKAQGSDLPQEAKSEMQGLPSGDFTKSEWMDKIKSMMMSKVGGGLGGNLGL